MFHIFFLENLYCYCWAPSLFSSKHLLNLLPKLVPYSLTRTDGGLGLFSNNERAQGEGTCR